MATERPVLSVAKAVNRAADVVDPLGKDDRIADLFARFEDRDEPVTAVGREVANELAEWKYRLDLQNDDPAVDVAIAIATYLIFKRREVDDADEELLRLAIRAEYHDQPPDYVRSWLEQR